MVRWFYQRATRRRYANISGARFEIVPAYQMSNNDKGYYLSGPDLFKKFRTVAMAKSHAENIA